MIWKIILVNIPHKIKYAETVYNHVIKVFRNAANLMFI